MQHRSIDIRTGEPRQRDVKRFRTIYRIENGVRTAVSTCKSETNLPAQLKNMREAFPGVEFEAGELKEIPGL